MKFIKKTFGKASVEVPVHDAVSHVVQAKTWGDGTVERVSDRVDALQDIVANILHELIECGALSRAEQVARILDSAYVTVED